LLKLIADEATKHVNAERATIFILDRTKGELTRARDVQSLLLLSIVPHYPNLWSKANYSVSKRRSDRSGAGAWDESNPQMRVRCSWTKIHMIRDAMTQTDSDRRRAAKVLGLSHQGLIK